MCVCVCFVSGEKVRSPVHFVTFFSESAVWPERKQPWAGGDVTDSKIETIRRRVGGGGGGGGGGSGCQT